MEIEEYRYDHDWPPETQALKERDGRIYSRRNTILVLTASFLFTAFLMYESNPLSIERRHQKIDLVRSIAAGEDHILDSKEALRMARELGYTGALSDQQPIDLSYHCDHTGCGALLSNGSNNHWISEDSLDAYLSDHR